MCVRRNRRLLRERNCWKVEGHAAETRAQNGHWYIDTFLGPYFSLLSLFLRPVIHSKLLCTTILSRTQRRTIRLFRVPGFIPFLTVYPYSYYSYLFSYKNPCTIYSSDSSDISVPSFPSLSRVPCSKAPPNQSLSSLSFPLDFRAHSDAVTLLAFHQQFHLQQSG